MTAKEESKNKTEDGGGIQKEDSFVKLIGEHGKWQLIVFCTVCLIKFPTGWVQLNILFLTPRPVFWCVEFENGSSTLVGSNSTCYDDCVRYTYDASPLTSTAVTEFDLVCERAWLASFTQTMLQLGILIGSIVFGFMADRFGRKNSFLVAVVSLVGLGFGVPFSPNYIVFTTLRFLLGFVSAGTMGISFVIIMEAVGPRYRELFASLYQIPFVFGHLAVPLVAFYFRSWDTYLLVLAATSVVFLAYVFIVSESPRWLLSVGRVEEATVIVTKIIKINKLPMDNIEETLTKLSLSMRQRDDQPELNYTALARRELRLRTLCSIAMWLVAGLTFFGFNQYMSQSSDNPFLSASISALVQFPALFASVFVIKALGRKLTTICSFLICGASIIALGFVPQVPALTLTLATIGSGFASIIANCVYIWGSELFPTVVRNMGIGVSSMAMRVGSMIAPFVADLSTTAYWLPPVIFGVAPIVTVSVLLMLPETKGRKLPDSIEELNSEIKQN